ncbi:MAG TPA: winged helix-turn-helix transcriptional regulator [Jiangellaceae bacterium]|nr:winged helix-turn-helix transcriptional regulator [Jiangellaceae bacterium]
MRSHDQYCPVAKAAEALGDRWSLLLVREMLHGVDRFNEFERCLPGISRSVLSQRLRQLQRDGVAERRVGIDGQTTRYELTQAGRELDAVVQVLGDWATRWIVREPTPKELDPDLLMLWISRHVDRAQLPGRRVVIEFSLGTPKRRHYWLVTTPEEVSLCVTHPGFDPDIIITADVGALYLVYSGRASFAHAVREDEVLVEGPPALCRQLSRWFTWSRFAAAAARPPDEDATRSSASHQGESAVRRAR